MLNAPTKAPALLGLAALLTFGLTACGSNDDTDKKSAGDAHTATVTITAAKGCEISPSTLAAGGVTFKIANKDATAVSEIELLSGSRIVGEKENLPPGLSGEFSATVSAGDYTLYCPGATPERRTIKVTGTASSVSDDTAALLKQATDGWSQYVETQVGYLLEGATALNTTLHGSDLKAAQDAYKKARPFYEKIEPVAESFVSDEQDLDADIDARDGDVEPDQWSGFHRIEKGLFEDQSLNGLGTYGDKLVADVTKLQGLVKGLTYDPTELANGAQDLLDEAASSKISGEEERYSHIDMVDFANNVEGAGQAFANLQPVVAKIDPTLASTIQAKFEAATDLINKYRSSSDASGFVLYSSLTDSDKQQLAAAIKAVQEPLSTVGSKVATVQ